MTKAIVLSSGGVDSTTCLGLAVSIYGADNVVSVSVYYGQKHDKELAAAEKIAYYYGVSHKVLDFSKVGIFEDSKCTLLKGRGDIEHGSYEQQIEEHGEVQSYVPFRNGLLLSAVASMAYAMCEADDKCNIFLGAHADDVAGAAYADCTPEFSDAIAKAINLGTYGKVEVCMPLINKTKEEVVALGLSLSVPYELTWSCYEGGDRPCGKCGTCIDRAKAFEANGVKDPALV